MDLNDPQKVEFLRDAYRKHANELLAIEEGQRKLTALLLAMLGAGATFIAERQQKQQQGVQLPILAKWGLTIGAVSTLVVAVVYTCFRHYARQDVRRMLTRCEKALGFETKGEYIDGETLFETVQGANPEKFQFRGWWLDSMMILLVTGGAVAFIMATWSN